MADRDGSSLRGMGWLAALVAVVLAIEIGYGFCLQDDAYISFRYAQNAVNGHGLVFNVGERVEGYSNFLWTVTIAGAMSIGISPEVWVVSCGVFASLALVCALWWVGRRSGLSPTQALVAPALVGLHGGLTLEAVQGLESVAFALLVFVAVDECARVESRSGLRAWLGPVALGLAVLTRPEGLGVLVLIVLGLRLGGRRWTRRAVALGIGVALAHLAFRVGYYGDLLPNTFYAKTGMAGAVWVRGLSYVGGFFAHMPQLLLLLALGWASRGHGEAFRDRHPRLFVHVVVVIGYLAYVVVVGGDFKQTGRFILPILPSVALLVQWTLWNGLDRVATPERRRIMLVCFGGISAIALIADWQRCRGWAEQTGALLAQRVVVGTVLAAQCEPNTRVAIHSSGVVPYVSGLPTLDMWGLNDRHIARAPIADRGEGKAGHEARDYEYVLSERPDLVLPEGGLLTPQPVVLEIPAVLPNGFSDAYISFSAPLPAATHGVASSEPLFLNGWRLRDGAEGEHVLLKALCA